MAIQWNATIDDLKRTDLEGQVELVGGRLVQLPFHVEAVADIVGNLSVALRAYASRDPRRTARAYTSTLVYRVDLPHRKSISPDVSYAIARPANRMDFMPCAPKFAAEIRGPDEFTAAVDHAFTHKRRDYFAAGTEIVWDVDPIAHTVTSYHRDAPEEPTVFGSGEEAHAEPALPGWRISVDDLFSA